MDDSRIVELYWERSETAITETADKYGGYCFSIANGILYDPTEAEECVNDTYMSAWSAIPPARPAVLSTFLGKITRRISIDRWRRRTAEKRGGGELPLALDELEEVVGEESEVEKHFDRELISETVSAFLRSLPRTERQVFVCRYWYMDSIGDICRRFYFTESKVKSMLYRTREKLRELLESEGLL